MRILVTGAAGYIGSIAIERFDELGHDVVALDNLWRGHRAALPRRIRFEECDLQDRERTEHVLGSVRPDAVVHFAAATLVSESVRDPGPYYGANVVGSHNLFEAMRAADVGTIVFSSTAAVYGMPEVLPIHEDAEKRPINPYGQSKLMVERMLESYGAAYGFRYAALRYFNVAGATRDRGEDHDPETHVIPVALQTLLGRRDRFSVFGTDYPTPDGTAVRDYVHVLDLADAHAAALERLDGSLGAINLGTKGGFSVREIVAAVERVTGRTLPVAYEPRRAGDPPALVADASRAAEVLGWTPRRSTLDQMVGSAWDWMQRHPEGYGG
ncbi:MAG: UDP-glucose 4-epimerase GalE [Chloroflexota bacterium]|nr:UDP-glucose 4-epimerase GalE [Chloroflexota bacterium]